MHLKFKGRWFQLFSWGIFNFREWGLWFGRRWPYEGHNFVTFYSWRIGWLELRTFPKIKEAPDGQ